MADSISQNHFPHATPPAACPDASHPQCAVDGHRVCLVKGEHRWTFRWGAGDESAVIARASEMARDPALPFDWFDAAIICRHVVPQRSGGNGPSGVHDEN